MDIKLKDFMFLFKKKNFPFSVFQKYIIRCNFLHVSLLIMNSSRINKVLIHFYHL